MWCRAIERSLLCCWGHGRPCHDGLPEKLGVTPCPPLADLSTDTMGGEDSEDPQEPNSAPGEAAARSTAVKAGGAAAAACVVVLLLGTAVAFSGGDEDESGEGACYCRWPRQSSPAASGTSRALRAGPGWR